MTNQEKLIKIFSGALGVDEKVITDELQYSSIPEWDSVALMSLVVEMEEAFAII